MREDAQQALLKLDKASKKNPFFIAPAYQITAPKNILDENAPVVPEQEYLSKITDKFCHHCGLKICTCSKRLDYEEQKTFDDYDPEGPKYYNPSK